MKKIDYEETKGKYFEDPVTKFNNFLHTIAIYGLLLIFIAMIIWVFNHEPKIVSGESMQPTINSEYSKEENKFDIAIVNRNVGTVYKQDIVIIDFSSYKRDELIIKRVIATGGDTIKIVWNNDERRSVVYLKKKGESQLLRQDENYVAVSSSNCCAKTFNEGVSKGYVETSSKTTYVWDSNAYKKNEDGSITINEGYIFVLGDNRELSLDSSEVGPLSLDKVKFVAEIIVPEGSLLNKIIKLLFHFNLNN